MADNVMDTVNEKVKAFADSIGVSGVTVDQVTQLALGMAVSAADAALVYLGDNVSKVDFGTWTALVVTVTSVVVREGRNMLHGGKVVSGTTLEAVQPEQPAEADGAKEGAAPPSAEEDKPKAKKK